MTSELIQKAENFLINDIASAMDGYEARHSQIHMMDACAGVIETGGTLIAEAGTGTGKTFAYLVPIILSGKKAVISTKTINLQEQLVSKDLRFLAALKDFKFAIAKGRGHYICLRRLHAFQPDGVDETADQKNIREWAEETATGDIEDYSQYKRPLIWDRVCSDSDACKGKKCGYFRECHYFSARTRWESAQVVVTNHALLTVNAMMEQDKKIIPAADILVIDEGHSLDSIISDQIGINLSDRGMDRTFNKLLKMDHRGIYKGILSKTPALFPEVEALRIETGFFWARVRSAEESRKIIRGAFNLKEQLSTLAASVKGLLNNIRTSAMGLFTEDEELELKAEVIKLRSMCEGMEVFREEVDGFVRWAEVDEKKTALRMAPVYPSEFVRTNLVSDFSSIILTSATLAISGDFGLIENILGLRNTMKLALPSPFDLRKQVKVSIKKGIDLQADSGAGKLAQVIVKEASEIKGGTLVLFTSRSAMKKTWEICSEELAAAGLSPMVQGELSNKKMLDSMRGNTNSVIFGLDSFWEGVDVKGDSLNCLIITKLPFEVPSEPIVAARTEEIKKRGGNPFRDYSLPRAILKFKQGFGRLIRSKDDRGKVIICDERIETKDYGRGFLKSIE